MHASGYASTKPADPDYTCILCLRLSATGPLGRVDGRRVRTNVMFILEGGVAG